MDAIGLLMNANYAHYKPQIKPESQPMMRTTRKPRRGKPSRMATYAHNPKLFAERVNLILQTKFRSSRRRWADAAGVADTNFRKILNEVANPELVTLWALAKAAGVTVSQLIGETPLDDPEKPTAAPDERLIRIAADLRHYGADAPSGRRARKPDAAPPDYRIGGPRRVIQSIRMMPATQTKASVPIGS